MKPMTIHLDLQLISDRVNTPSLPTQGRFTHPRPVPHWAHQKDHNHKRLRPSQPALRWQRKKTQRGTKAGRLSDLHQQQVRQQASATPSHPLRRSGGEGDPCQAPSPPSGTRQAGLGNEAGRCLRSVLCVRVARELTGGVADPGLAWDSPVRDTQHSAPLPRTHTPGSRRLLFSVRPSCAF